MFYRCTSCIFDFLICRLLTKYLLNYENYLQMIFEKLFAKFTLMFPKNFITNFEKFYKLFTNFEKYFKIILKFYLLAGILYHIYYF